MQINLGKGVCLTEGKLWCVYIHTNKCNGKKYVGITSQKPEKRWLGGHGYASRLPIGRAIRKYGWDNFEHDIVCSNLSERAAKNIEVSLIKQLHTQEDRYGYNITSGGDGVPGMRHTEEAKRKMSLAKSGQNHPNWGKHLSQETRLKIGAKSLNNSYAKGCVRSEETRRKMSESKEKPVAMMEGNEVLRVFKSGKDAQAETGINRKNISMCCLNKRPRAGGYAWKFA